MFRLLKIENARMNVPEPEYLEVTAAEAVAEGEALVLSGGKLTKMRCYHCTYVHCNGRKGRK